MAAVGFAATTAIVTSAHAANPYYFQAVPAGGTASSIAGGPEGAVWITGNNPVGNGGYAIYQFVPGTVPNYVDSTWQHRGSQYTAGVDIAIGPSGTPWVVNLGGGLFDWNGSDFPAFTPSPPGNCVTAVATDLHGFPWVIGCEGFGSTNAGNVISRWNGSSWVTLTGTAATQIAMSPAGVPWVVNGLSQIFKWNGSTFVQFGPAGTCATDIAIGGDENPWVVGCSQTFQPAAGKDVFYWNGSAWTGPYGSGVKIAVATGVGETTFGTPWLVNSGGGISYLRTSN